MQIWRRHIKPRLILWKAPWKRDIGLLLLSLVWFIFCIYMVALANAYADRKNPNTNKPPEQRYVSPDALMDATEGWFYRSSLPRNISDICVVIAGGLMVLFALTRGPACVTLVRRALLIVGSLYLGRVPYMLLTVLPAPYTYCFTPIDPNFGKDSWKLLTGQRVDCGDTFYSGHTIVFASCLLMFWYHCRFFWITILVLLFCLFGMVSLVFSTYHYTIDVLGAFVFTFLCWWLYHLAVEVDGIGNKRWWGKLIRWFDNNGHEVLEAKEGHKRLMMAATGTGTVEPIEMLPTHVQPATEVMGRRSGEIVELPRLSLSDISRESTTGAVRSAWGRASSSLEREHVEIRITDSEGRLRP